MSYSNTPSRSLVGDDYLSQRVDKMSLQNDYGDGIYNVGGSDPYETQTDSMGGQWDYVPPETRNLDTIVAEMTAEEVRWFYKTDGEKRWLEFSGYDSYRTEMRYREMYKNDYGSKYSSYSAFSDPSSGPSSIGGMGTQFGSSSIRFPNKQQPGHYGGASSSGPYSYGDQQHQHKIVVRGGLYDVNFDTMKCCSIYWPGEECLITRGTWFYEGTWQPLEREQSNILENKHLQMFKGRKMNEFSDNEAKGTPVHTETFPEFIVEWLSPSQVYLYSENKPSKIVRSVTSRLGFHKSTGYRLFRGYKSEATLDDRPDVEINHLVFVIHGIGQKMDTGRIIRNTSSLRDCVSWLKQKYFMNFPHHRAEFFPVEWRSNLQLDGELVDAITPNTLQSLRQMLNASAMDIMYYTSPLYGGEVQRGLREELNRLYSMFSARNPYFMNKGGKISVIAHSLGCVILYDIIMGLKPGSLVQNSQQGLLFQIQNFFCLGSPLAVFLALRWKDSQIPGKLNTILPQRLCHRLYNVFHPTDPVAYRVEPLLVKEYYRIAPLIIQPYNATFHTPYSEMPLEMQGPDQFPGQNTNQSTGQRDDTNTGGPPISPGRERSWSIWGLMKGPRRISDGSGLDFLEQGLEYRLDYILRESNLGVSYLSALTSHTAYWTNYDIAYFILTQIFPEFETNPGGMTLTSHSSDNPYMDKYNSYTNTTDTHYGDSHSRGIYEDPHQFRQQPPQQMTMTPSQPTGVQPRPEFNLHQDTYGASQTPHFQDNYQQPGYQPGYQEPIGPHAPSQQFPQTQSYTQQQFSGPPAHQTGFSGPSSVQQFPQQQPAQNIQQSFQPHQPPMHQQMQHQQQQMNQQVMRNQQHQQQQHQLQQQQHHQQQQKTGFFGSSSDGKQNVSSPTKGTKSFFPSFNLSSLTSPVKNLSNSLSNISNQMTNMVPQKDGGILQNQQQLQQQQQQQSRSSFLGGTQPNRGNIQNQSQGHFGQQQFVNQTPNQSFLGGNQMHQGMSQQMHMSNPQQGMGVRAMSPHEKQQQQMGIRSSSPVNIQNRVSPMQYGPLETPTGAIKPKMTRIQPKIPGSYENKISYATPMFEQQQLVGNRNRCVSPLGQSKVICSGSSPATATRNNMLTGSLTGSYNLGLGARSLSSGNLRNSTIVSGSYPGTTRTSVGVGFVNQTQFASSSSSPTTSLSRRTMSRPNLSSTGSSFHNPTSTSLGMSSLVYNSNYGGKTFLSREYSGPNSR